MIECAGITKSYRAGNSKVDAVSNVSLKIEQPGFFAIVGPSGAGKTTLLNILSGMDQPDQGKVFLKGKDLWALRGGKRERLINTSVGFVFQFYHLMGDLTALENVMLPARIYQNKRTCVLRKKALELLSEMKIENRAGHLPNELSGGERQRVAIARSLMNDPEIIFGDEPTGNLDSITGSVICEFLNRMAREHHKTVLIVTHDDKITQYADRTWVLKDGKWE